MSGGGGGGEKTEKPTPKRLKEARKEGRVARTQDLGAWTLVLVASVVAKIGFSHAGQELVALVGRWPQAVADPEASSLASVGAAGARALAWGVLPLGLALAVTAFAIGAAQGGVHVATKNLKPQLKNLNPVNGIKRMAGPHAVWEAVKAVAKSTVIGFLIYRTCRDLVPQLVGTGPLPLSSVLATAGASVLSLVRDVALAGLVMGAADYAYQRRRLDKQLRMTKQEIKEEARQSEGDPHVKGQIRSRQLAMSRNRMMSDVATADVVVVNPTHVAVALRYDPAKGAPRVVAKGAGTVAAKIRERAAEHRVPLVQDVPLARALHRACDLGDEIPAELYAAVARVLAFIMSLKARGVASGTHRLPPERALARR